MAQLVLSNVGQAVGSRIGPAATRSFFAALGQTGGAMLGRSIDQRLFGESTRYQGARLTDLHIQGSTEGASIPAIYGRVRIAGQLIWAARFKEHEETTDIGGGGKGGSPRSTRTDYRYTLSFAVGLCEGEIARVGRVWANGEPFDLSDAAWRLHVGAEDQAPDPLIEAIEGAENAPAYRGLAYIVFENLPLERFGNTIPQLSFEIVRQVRADGPRFEDRVRGVCLIPGSGEFVYATEPIRRVIGPGAEALENVHAERERANLRVSLDQLESDFPNCDYVMLVVAWFGDDLRCGECQIRPGVEIAEKDTAPMLWRVGGVNRDGAHLVNHVDGAPAYGGTPSDASVLQAIAELKSRGFKIGLYPFVLMDVPAESGLPDPYGGAEQAAYPWRGRISVHPAAGEPSTADKTSAAATQVDAFFGSAAPADFGASAGVPSYTGPNEWSYRRFVLHHAKLAQLAGGVDAFILGSEMRALTTARSGATAFPAVSALKALAADVRGMVGEDTILTYAADWSEYGGHQPQDASGDVLFHLDPLWSDDNIDVVGVDWYPPLTDWRDGRTHLDAEIARYAHDPAYLQSRIEAGEAYDFWYADEAARAAQTRGAISDGAHGEPWIYRAKDIRNFWARAHHDRSGGVRSSTPTGWVPESKPVWLIELGCPAIDKGANAPNLFIDAKSNESAAPPFSSGARDDLIQRRMLDAYLTYWDADGDNNPISSVTDTPMIESMFLWAWDARPYPAFPARSDVWTDGASWRRGHWLNGRAGLAGLGEVVADLCARADVMDADVSALRGAVSGFVADAPATTRALIEPLMAAYDFTATERDGQLVFFHADEAEPTTIDASEFAEESAADLRSERADAAELPIEARVRFLDASRDYRVASVSARRLDHADGGVVTMEAPLVMEGEAAEGLAQRLLADARAAGEAARLSLGPQHLALEAGDSVSFNGETFEIARIEDAEARRMELQRTRSGALGDLHLAEPSAPPHPAFAPTPAFALLDLPPLPGAEDDERPLVAAFASPWLGAHEVYAGASDDAVTLRGRVPRPAVMGELLWALAQGPVGRWDNGNRVRIRLYGGTLASADADAVLNGANIFAIESDANEWEVIQARECVLVESGVYELSGFLRGQVGSQHAMRSPHPVGARIVKLDARLARLSFGAHEWNDNLVFATPPAGAAFNDTRTAWIGAALPHAATRPWPPAHLRAKRVSGDVHVSWVRCAHKHGDQWGAGDPPFGFGAEAYRLDILDGVTLKRTVTVSSPVYVYSAADQTVDFGSPPGSLTLRVAQLGDGGAPGLQKQTTVLL